METKLQELIKDVCDGFTSPDVSVMHITDARRFAIMAYHAWKHNIAFHPDMFKEALEATEMFETLSDQEIEEKSNNLCHHADFAKMMFRTAFEIERLSL